MDIKELRTIQEESVDYKRKYDDLKNSLRTEARTEAKEARVRYQILDAQLKKYNQVFDININDLLKTFNNHPQIKNAILGFNFVEKPLIEIEDKFGDLYKIERIYTTSIELETQDDSHISVPIFKENCSVVSNNKDLLQFNEDSIKNRLMKKEINLINNCTLHIPSVEYSEPCTTYTNINIEDVLWDSVKLSINEKLLNKNNKLLEQKKQVNTEIKNLNTQDINALIR